MSQLPPDFFDSGPEEYEVSPPRRRLPPGLTAALCTAAVLTAAAFFVYSSVFRIVNVTVMGNRNVPYDQVVQSAGLNRSVSYFALKEEDVRKGIEANQYLIYKGMEKRFPDTVILHVEERTPCANLQTSSAFYRIAKDGMVLSRTEDGQMDTSMLLVTGFQARDVRVGSFLAPGVESKLEAFSAVIEELTLQDFIGSISELDLSNPENLYLTTVDGYTVHLGNKDNLQGKIGTVRAVVAKLQEMGETGGVIEASVAGEAIYTPENL